MHDPAIQKILNETKPDWEWKPMLLEENQNGWRIDTGLLMQVRLSVLLGPLRAIQLWWKIDDSISNVDLPRRRFLRLSGLGMAALTLRLPGFKALPEQSADQFLAPPIGDLPPNSELFAGFLLLPEHTLVPDWVERPGKPEKGITFVRFDTIQEARDYLGKPFYQLTSTPTEMELIEVSIYEDARNGRLVEIRQDYGKYNPENDQVENLISFSAYSSFMRPYPLWSDSLPLPLEQMPPHVKSTEGMIVPQKFYDTPAPSAIKPSMLGHVIYWIENPILYSLAVEHTGDFQQVKAIVASLVKI